MLDWNEQIKAHFVWIWGGESGFFKRGREGMLVITDKRIVFITKTEIKYRAHDTYAQRQLIRFKENENTFRPIEDYGINELDKDIEKSQDNLQILFNKIKDIDYEDKRWGTSLSVKFYQKYDVKEYKFSIVKGWVKYPAKDPLQFQHMDWTPLINLFKSFK